MDFKSDALLIKSCDYGESDKIITLLTADRGKLTAGMKGVRKAGGKTERSSAHLAFRFCAQGITCDFQRAA